MIGLSDAFVMTIIFSTITARHVIKGFAEEPWMFYLGSFVDVLGQCFLTWGKLPIWGNL